MLFNKFRLSGKSAGARLKLSGVAAITTWEQYYESYTDTLNAIMSAGIGQGYPYNCNARPILFLMRHCLELQLKAEAARQGLPVPLSHDFKDMAEPFGGIAALPEKLQTLISTIDRDPDGSCYRYARDPTTGELYFPGGSQVETSKFFKDHADMVVAGIYGARSISPAIDFDNKHREWDLTFHMGRAIPCGKLGASIMG
ncbi:hypothetical protein MKQ70_32290 [Chitinophaga sedimenti]|uniref:hypothetical protein n=1 Tax=Chitinophaga sedimenti TaxID=2033606 RepID=UPI002006B232|nr:hypothetical protein [Chitinophaga sedimenti]MCK7559397.1 hypothetical protein [Chitinophaga sedimenti]